MWNYTSVSIMVSTLEFSSQHRAATTQVLPFFLPQTVWCSFATSVDYVPSNSKVQIDGERVCLTKF